MAYEAMPARGKMLLQTSLLPSKQEWEERNLPVTMTPSALPQIHHA